MKRLSLVAVLVLGCSGVRPAPDSGTPPVDPSPIDLSQWQGLGLDPDGGTLELIAELTKAYRGEAADLDGDGVRELSVLRRADGSRVITSTVGGNVEFTVEPVDGGLTYTYYYRNYAYPPLVDTYYPDRRVTLWDADLNYRFERRLTQRDVDAGVVEVVTEVIDGGAFVVAQVWQGLKTTDQESHRDALFGCDGNSNFPESFPAALATSVSFSDAAGVSCDPMQRSKLAQALQCAKDKLKGCMAENNPTLASRIKSHLVTDQVLLGCGNPCGGKYASTTPKSETSAARMNFAKMYVDNYDSTKLCALLLHELAHVAEVGFSDDHDDGLDEVYACANYCGGCQHLGPYGSPPTYKHTAPTDNENCARCGQTESERRKCGTRIKKTMGACVSNYTLCHAGLGGNALCESCGNLETKDCVDKEVAPIRFDCCICPSTHPNNDKMCPTNAMETDTCNVPPPACGP